MLILLLMMMSFVVKRRSLRGYETEMHTVFDNPPNVALTLLAVIPVDDLPLTVTPLGKTSSAVSSVATVVSAVTAFEAIEVIDAVDVTRKS